MLKKLDDDVMGADDHDVNELIDDVWIDFTKTRQENEDKLNSVMKDEVNDRLLQYLRQNSEYISGPIEKHMKMIANGEHVSLEERMGNLNMIAMER